MAGLTPEAVNTAIPHRPPAMSGSAPPSGPGAGSPRRSGAGTVLSTAADGPCVGLDPRDAAWRWAPAAPAADAPCTASGIRAAAAGRAGIVVEMGSTPLERIARLESLRAITPTLARWSLEALDADAAALGGLAGAHGRAEPGSPSRTWVVVDVGSRAAAASVLRQVGPGHFERLATVQDAAAGEQALDEAMVDWFCTRTDGLCGSAADRPGLRASARLARAALRAVEHVPFGHRSACGSAATVRLGRDILETLLQPLGLRWLRLVHRALSQAGGLALSAVVVVPVGALVDGPGFIARLRHEGIAVTEPPGDGNHRVALGAWHWTVAGGGARVEDRGAARATSQGAGAERREGEPRASRSPRGRADALHFASNG